MRKLKSMVSALALISALALTSCQQPSTPEVGDSTTTPQTDTSELTLEEVNKMFGDTIVALNGANYIDLIKCSTGVMIKDINGLVVSDAVSIKENKFQIKSTLSEIAQNSNARQNQQDNFINYIYSIINYKIVKTDTGDDLIYMNVFIDYGDTGKEVYVDAIQQIIFNPKTSTIIFHDQYGSLFMNQQMSKQGILGCSKNYILSKATAEEVQADFTEKDVDYFIALTCSPDNTFIYNEKISGADSVLNKVVETPIVVEKNKIKFGEQTADYTINAEDIGKIDISNSSIKVLPDGAYSYLITANVKDGKKIPGLTLTNTTNEAIKYTLGSGELVEAVVPNIVIDVVFQ